MLMLALDQLLATKTFEAISVQDIVDAASLNRATFYLHYPDKAALLHALTDMRFRELTARRGLSFTDCDGSLRGIALGVCDYLVEHGTLPDRPVPQPLEHSIIPVVEAILLEGAPDHPLAPGTDVSMLVATAAWAIFGAARLWFQTPNRSPAEKASAKIEQLVRPIFVAASQPNIPTGLG